MGPPVIEAHARDLWTAGDGTGTTVATAHIAARLDGPRHHLVEIVTTPAVDGLGALVGAVVGPGFRAKVDAAVPALRGTGALLYLLLDDLPGATLVSGYSMLHAGVVGRVPHDEYLDARGDLCAGWRIGGTMLRSVEEIGRPPMLQGPVAPELDAGGDVMAWHELPAAMTPNGMRRIRRIDVARGGGDTDPLVVDAMFRDTHMDDHGVVRIVHEYHLAAEVEPETFTIVSIMATPRVLPYRECPDAAASAQRVVGVTTTGLRAHTRAELVGASTCTHLNDVLRALEDVEPLAGAITEEASR